MKFTGERLVPEFNDRSFLYEEHIARYRFAENFCEGKTVLDIACGSGYGAALLSKKAKKVYGVDISKEAIEYSNKNYKEPNIEFIVGDVRAIPVEDNSIDLAVSFETIEHVNYNEQEKFIGEIKRILKKDGVFICSTPNMANYPSGSQFHKGELSLEKFKRILGKGFKNIFIYHQDLLSASYFINSEDNKEQTFNRIDQIDTTKSKFLVAVCSNKSLNAENTLYFGKLKPKDVEYELRWKIDELESEQGKELFPSRTWKKIKGFLKRIKA